LDEGASGAPMKARSSARRQAQVRARSAAEESQADGCPRPATEGVQARLGMGSPEGAVARAPTDVRLMRGEMRVPVLYCGDERARP